MTVENQIIMHNALGEDHKRRYRAERAIPPATMSRSLEKFVMRENLLGGLMDVASLLGLYSIHLHARERQDQTKRT